MVDLDARVFRRDGFIVARGLLSHRAIAECLLEMTAAFNAIAVRRDIALARSADMADLSRVMIELFRADMAAYLATAKLVQHAVSLHRIGCDEKIIGALRSLGLSLPIISTRPVLFFVSDALQVPGGYHKTPPHQDWRSIQGSLDSVVVWAPFSPTGLGSHPLEVLPESHRLGLLPSSEDVFGHRVAIELSDDAFIPLSVEPGDAVILSTLLVHRTGVTGGDGVRAAASFRYNNVTEPSFVDRSYPNPYIYKPDMRLLANNVATPEHIARIFDEK